MAVQWWLFPLWASIVHGFNSNLYNKILMKMRIAWVNMIWVFKYRVGYSPKLLRYFEFTRQFILIIRSNLSMKFTLQIKLHLANCRLYNLLIKALFRSDCLTLSSNTVLHLALALAISALKWLTGRKRWCVRPLCKLYHRQSRDRWYPHLGASRIPMEKQRKSAL